MQNVTKIPKLSVREPNAHKGSFGKVCIVAGSIGMSGAAAIAGRSALRSGAGLVRVAIPKSILPVIAAVEPCYTTIPLPEDKNGCISGKAIDILLRQADDNDVMAFGPGLSQGKGVRNVLETLVAQDGLKLVIDADGINCLAKSIGWAERRKASIILTPHPGEMKRLWKGLFREPITGDKSEQAIAVAERTDCVVVLKGAGTIVTDGEKIYVNTTGNPGMAAGGSGDVLTGVIAALVGQGLDDFDSAVLGVYIHGRAGDIAAERNGQVSLIATDIIDALGEAFYG